MVAVEEKMKKKKKTTTTTAVAARYPPLSWHAGETPGYRTHENARAREYAKTAAVTRCRRDAAARSKQ